MAVRPIVVAHSHISLADVRRRKIAVPSRHVFRFCAAAFLCETGYLERAYSALEFAFGLWKTVRCRSANGDILPAPRGLLSFLRTNCVAHLLRDARLAGRRRHVRAR